MREMDLDYLRPGLASNAGMLIGSTVGGRSGKRLVW